MGIVLQDPADNLLDYLRAVEQVELAARLRGVDPAEAPALLDAVGLADRARSYPGGAVGRRAAAGGVRRRPPIGRPTLLLADEPTAELDAAAGADPGRSMRAPGRPRGATLVVASHDPAVDRRRRPRASRCATGGWSRDADGSGPAERRASPSAGVREVLRHARRVPARCSTASTSRSTGGEVVAIAGRSGSGKTTLLTIIAGWEHADAGSVALSAARPAATQRRWRELAILPQSLGLLDELTVAENVGLPLRLAAPPVDGRRPCRADGPAGRRPPRRPLPERGARWASSSGPRSPGRPSSGPRCCWPTSPCTRTRSGPRR